MTLTDPKALQRQLRQIEQQGCAECLGNFELDVHSFAVPLFDALGNCIGALFTAAIATRVTPDLARHIRTALFQSACRIISLWGGALPAKADAIWSVSGIPAPEQT
jgi:DNA-binding IclR family transcriptional regulator